MNTYLIYTPILGIAVCEPFEDSYDVLGNEDFILALDSAADKTEVLLGVVDKHNFDIIERTYGVNK